MTDAFAAYCDFDAWQAEARGRQCNGSGIRPGAELPGLCEACGAADGFSIDATSARADGSLRETLACRRCGCNARQRAAAALLLQAIAADKRPRVYATEQASPFFVALRRRLPGLCGSEFSVSWKQRLRLSVWLLRQGRWQAVRRQDVTALSFVDGCFDAVVSLDVLEHVPDFQAALREFARVLRPGAALVLTVPFHFDRPNSRTLARLRPDGGIEHLRQPPEYHCDPLGNDVLCFHHFGWDLLDAMRTAGFANAEAVRVHDLARGLPEPLWVLRARR